MESSRIFIRGLPPNFGPEDFKAHFSKQANVTDMKLLPHRRIGYVGYKTPEDAAKAVKYHNKTFIRMSRIGVEPARSVEEQYALRPAANATNGVKRKFGVIKDNLAERPREDAQGKQDLKREIGQAGEGKAKLQEFLEVMQPPSKSKIWENQAAPAAQVPAETILLSEPHKTADATSDGEYEPVPKKQKGERAKTWKAELANESTRLQDEEVEAVNQSDTGIPLVAEKETEEATYKPHGSTQVASDADWLRSRTSRLLGLLDDDVASESTAYPDDREGQDTANLKLSQPIHSGNIPDASFTDQDEPNENLSKNAPLPGLEDPQQGNGRLFVRNLTYTTTEDDLRRLFASYGTIKELHLPIDSRTASNKGFAHIEYAEPEAAAIALQNVDRRPFQGRLLHVIPANAKRETGLDDFSTYSAISKLPLKKQQQIKKKAEAASSIFNWNSMYMNSDAVISSISDRLGVSKSDLLNPTSSDAAVKQAHAETHIIQETKSYFTANGVDLDAFKQRQRGDTAILVKNFSYGTRPEELRNLFEPHGHLTRILMPPCGTIAIVEFEHPEHARSAFGSLAYRKFKDSILFLEKAPKGLFGGISSSSKVPDTEAQKSKLLVKDLLEKDGSQEPVNTSTLFVRNLSFSTTTQRLREIFQPLDGLLSARVKTKPNPKKPGQHLSMGFGFLEFRTKDNAQAALSAMDGYKLDGHELLIRASHRAIDAAEERRTDDQAKKVAARKTKIIIKNLPFEASRKDVRSLFGPYGQLRSVRVPKKFDSSTRGFAFAEFVTAREAENAMDALRDTHLLGRRLVLDFAAEDAVDPEQEIEKMQQKVGKQADKVALQKLAGTARKKFDVEGGEELDEG